MGFSTVVGSIVSQALTQGASWLGDFTPAVVVTVALVLVGGVLALVIGAFRRG